MPWKPSFHVSAAALHVKRNDSEKVEQSSMCIDVHEVYRSCPVWCGDLRCGDLDPRSQEEHRGWPKVNTDQVRPELFSGAQMSVPG